MTKRGREPVPEDLPEGTAPEERRPARIRMVAARRLDGLAVVLDGVHDPHNISAVLRSCDGFGVQNVHLIGLSARPNRAICMGCDKWLTLHRYDSPADCVAALRAANYQLWAAMPDREAPSLEEIDFSKKIALVFGAERDGLSDELLRACDGRYQIYMPGFSESLNVSVAAAISIYVAARERRKSVAAPTDMTEAGINALAQRWLDLDAQRRAGRPVT